MQQCDFLLTGLQPYVRAEPTRTPLPQNQDLIQALHVVHSYTQTGWRGARITPNTAGPVKAIASSSSMVACQAL